MRFRFLLCAALGSLLLATPAASLVIDDFSSPDPADVHIGETFVTYSGVGSYGFDRDLLVYQASGTVTIGEGELALAPAPGGDIGLLLEYQLASFGYVDLTNGGTINAIDLTLEVTDPGTAIDDIIVSIDGGEAGGAFFSTGPFTAGEPSSPTTLSFPFASFLVDFPEEEFTPFVNARGVQIEFLVANVGLPSNSLHVQSIETVPEPSTAVLLSLGVAVIAARRRHN